MRLTFDDAVMLFDFADASMADCGTKKFTVMCKYGNGDGASVRGYACDNADDVYRRVCNAWLDGAEVWVMPR